MKNMFGSSIAWADFVITDAECSCLKPVHIVSIESRQHVNNMGIMSTASSWRSLEIELATQANVDTREMLPGW